MVPPSKRLSAAVPKSPSLNPACSDDSPPPGVRIEDILATVELARRPAKAPDFRAENQALSALATTMATAPAELFQHLVEAALALCGAQSAGISLLEQRDGKRVFRWHATAGIFGPLKGQELPRDFSPCGVVVDRDALQLMVSPAKYYPYMKNVPEVQEALLVPFHRRGNAVGTLWVVAHKRETKFDGEDARIVTSLARFAAAASEVVHAQAEYALSRGAEQEREAIADELRRLSAIHETVLSATNDFAYVFDREGRFLYANRRLLTVWAKTLDQVIGKTCYELGYPEWHADMHMREIAQVIETRRPIRGEVPFTGDSGISGVYDYIFTPVFDAKGEVELIAGTTRDVTDRRRRENRDKFLVSLDDTTRPLTDPQEITQTSARLLGEYLNVNRCAYADVEADENTFNLTGDFNNGVPSIVGRYRFDQFGAECLRLMREGLPYVVADAQSDPRTESVRASYEATLIRSVICVSLRKSGRFVAAMAVHQISPRHWQPDEIELVQLVANRCWESIERIRMTRVLEESEQQLRLAVETARLGIWERDLRTNAVTLSPQCKVNFGVAPEQSFTYADFLKAVHPDDLSRVQTAVQRAISNRINYDSEYQTVWPDGSVHWMLVRGRATYAADGTPLRLAGLTLDITERKQAERELKRLHDEAVKASRAKDDFLAALSHELRTPLNPVLLLASEAANDHDLSPWARESFEVIRKNVELEARLIDDLLDLTSIARGKLSVKKKTVSVHDLLNEAAASMRGDLADKDIVLELKLDAPQPTAQADAARILQVFLNLLRNAVKFTPRAGRVTVETRGADNDMIEISMADTGIGMTPAELTRAFGAFEQGDHAAMQGAHRFGGLGLGLAIARQLVELHGGTIEAQSKGRDQGATVVVRLPLATNAAGEVGADSDRSNKKREIEKFGLRVLLVEDHGPTRNALKHLLGRRNFRVTCAGSLAEARAFAYDQGFDFVISDIGLPDGDGTTLMSELREAFSLKGIALTGYGMEQDIARCHAAGFIAHLTKPVRVESLEAALAQIGQGR